MKQLTAILLSVLCLLSSVFGATGDITSCVIRPDGWTAVITIEGFSTGATYDFGFDTNNQPTADTPYLTVVRKTPGDDGAGTTLTDTVYLTSVVRFPYEAEYFAGSFTSGTFLDGETVTQATSGATAIVVGDQAAGDRLVVKVVTGTENNSNIWTGGTSSATFTPTATGASVGTLPVNDEKDIGTDINVLVSLSDYVYVKEVTGAGNSGTAPTVTIPAGWAVSGMNNSTAETAGAVTNNSTAAYQPELSAWAYPYHGTLMDSTTRLRVVSYGRHGRNGRPTRAVKFTVFDGTTTNTEIVTTPTWTAGFGDAVPVVEYVTTTDLTAGLTQGANLTLNFQSFPWVGDSDNDLISSDGGFTYPDARHCTLTAVCNNAGTYGVSYAVVDGTSGSDPAGVTVGDDAGKWVGNGTAHGAGGGVTAYATLARAARACRNYNNANHGRDTVSGSVVYVKAGTYNWLGASISGAYGATPGVFITFKPFTGVATADVIIGGVSGNTDVSDRVKLEGISIVSASGNLFSNCLAMWLDRCVINSTVTSQVWGSSGQCVWVTQCTVPSLAQGFKNFSSVTNMTFPLVRGCTLNGFDEIIFPYCVIGNSMINNPATSTLIEGSSGSGPVVNQSQIVAYNKFMDFPASSALLMTLGETSIVPVRGAAVVQNVFEFTGTSVSASMTLAAETLSADTYDNFIYWNNTSNGARELNAYNIGTTTKPRRYWSQKNNNFYDWGIKTDDSSSPHGNQVGNWPVVWQVGCSGNLQVSDTAQFLSYFAGLSTYKAVTPVSPINSMFKYVDYKAAEYTVGADGNGDYRLQSNSPARRLQRDWLIPYDITGKPRSPNEESSGAYAEGGVRPASMIFAQ